MAEITENGARIYPEITKDAAIALAKKLTEEMKGSAPPFIDAEKWNDDYWNALLKDSSRPCRMTDDFQKIVGSLNQMFPHLVYGLRSIKGKPIEDDDYVPFYDSDSAFKACFDAVMGKIGEELLEIFKKRFPNGDTDNLYSASYIQCMDNTRPVMAFHIDKSSYTPSKFPKEVYASLKSGKVIAQKMVFVWTFAFNTVHGTLAVKGEHHRLFNDDAKLIDPNNAGEITFVTPGPNEALVATAEGIPHYYRNAKPGIHTRGPNHANVPLMLSGKKAGYPPDLPMPPHSIGGIARIIYRYQPKDSDMLTHESLAHLLQVLAYHPEYDSPEERETLVTEYIERLAELKQFSGEKEWLDEMKPSLTEVFSISDKTERVGALAALRQQIAARGNDHTLAL
ncbi:MAG: hypothetical protein ABW189_07055 [Rickettsiales bacterium]